MFYSQARSLTGDNTYTYENAHDQVQAIRLMSQEIDDEDDLRRFITEHRSFNDAYAYLRKLARDRIRRVSCGNIFYDPDTKNQFSLK